MIRLIVKFQGRKFLKKRGEYQKKGLGVSSKICIYVYSILVYRVFWLFLASITFCFFCSTVIPAAISALVRRMVHLNKPSCKNEVFLQCVLQYQVLFCPMIVSMEPGGYCVFLNGRGVTKRNVTDYIYRSGKDHTWEDGMDSIIKQDNSSCKI